MGPASPPTQLGTGTRGYRIAFGLAVYNGEQFLGESVRALLSQTYPHFHLIISDNHSDDSTEEIARKLAASDARITYVRNDRNLGLIGNWRMAYQTAEKVLGELDYFAFAADHDLWHERWLEILLEIMESNPTAIMAHPKYRAIDVDGKLLDTKTPQFETKGLSRPDRAKAVATRLKRPGTAFHGLWRAQYLGLAQILPWCTAPDRYLMMRLALEGDYIFEPQELFFRRFPDKPPEDEIGTNDQEYVRYMDRQRDYLFGGNPPFHSHFPIFAHAGRLIVELSMDPRKWLHGKGHLGILMALRYVRWRRRYATLDFLAFINRVALRRSNWPLR
ncbi:MAG: glycosyltransferase family 2 protein [Chloroflexi bacterium]|nr:glycosyltransferase family 2 protein [Chloroflexota bacterium]